MSPDGSVELIGCMGTDDSIVNAARVSFGSDASKYTTEQNSKLIHYLAKHKHWSPFAHVFLSFRVTAPIFVARQLAKHQVGLAWNEISRRYVKTNPVVWCPSGFRAAAANVKQGSSDTIVGDSALFEKYAACVESAVRTYDEMIAANVCPEMARAVLPQGMMTAWVWSGSLYAFHRVVSQRTTPYAQQETKSIATAIQSVCLAQFPVASEALSIYK